MAGVDPKLGYVPAQPIEEETEKGNKIVWLTPPERPGQAAGQAIPVPIAYAREYLSGGYRAVTAEDMKVRQYAEEKLGLINNIKAQMGEYAPGFGVLAHTLDAGMDPKERELRKKASDTYTGDMEKFFLRGIPLAAETALTGGATKVAAAALKVGATSVKAAVTVGAAQGAVNVLDMYLDDPKVSGEAMAATMASSIFLSGATQALLNKGANALAKKGVSELMADTPQAMAKADELAYEMLTKAHFNTTELGKLQAKGPGALRDYAKFVAEEKLIQGNAGAARNALFQTKNEAKKTFDRIEEIATNSGGTISPKGLMDDVHTVYNDLVAASPEKRRTINRVTNELYEAIRGRGEMDFVTFRSWKSKLGGERELAKKAAATGSVEGSVKYDLYDQVWRKMDDVENRFIADIDTDGTLAPAWQRAQKQFSVLDDFSDAVNSRMSQELAANTSAYGDGIINKALTAYFAATGNFAGLGFNAAQVGGRMLREYKANPAHIAAQFNPSMEGGLVKRITAATLSKLRTKAILATGPVAQQIGYAVDDLETPTEREETAKKDAFLRSNISQLAEYMREEFTSEGGAQKYIEAMEPLGNISMDHGFVAAQQLNRIKTAVMTHLPQTVQPLLLDAVGDEKLELSDMEKEKTFEVLKAVLHPAEALQDPSAFQIQIINQTYPEFMNYYKQQMLSDLAQAHANGIKFSLEDKERYSTILQISSSVDNEKQFMARLQAFMANQAKQDQVPQPKRAPSASNFNSVSSNAETPSSRVGRL